MDPRKTACCVLGALTMTFAAAAPGLAQGPGRGATVPEQKEAMAELADWVGEWEGTGTYFHPGGSSAFTIHESVRPMLGGLVLLVEGIGRSKHPESGEEFVSHHALATLSYDPAADRYDFRHFTQDGDYGEDELRRTEAGFEWGMDPAPGVELLFETELDGDVWRETGKITRDGGETWHTMVQMELRRVGSPSSAR